VNITEALNLRNDETIEQVALGQQFSTALTTSGRVFTWGDNRLGQLGDSTLLPKTVPTDITRHFTLSNDTITHLVMGSAHAGALSAQGELFLWGNAENGRLGDGLTQERAQTTPLNVTNRLNLRSNETIVDVALGGAHTGIITSEGRVLLWGWNAFGQLGDGTNEDRAEAIDITAHLGLLDGEMPIALRLGGQHSVLLTSYSRVIGWGDNTHGALMRELSSPLKVPSELPLTPYLLPNETVEDVHVGLEHTLLTTALGRVMAVGSNRRGQLGDGTTQTRFVPSVPRNVDFEGIETREILFEAPLELETLFSDLKGFEGWMLDPFYATALSFETMPARPLNLYARILHD
jgi:alpha-tubulin suppressor-like RCC1 family protein